jgi:5'-methylthioadenosine phosphorylase
MHQQAGFSVIGMTTMPEATLARELAMCFTTIALVTDHDVGVDGGAPVTHHSVLEAFSANVDRLKGLVADAVAALPAPDDEPTCSCRRALDGMRLPIDLP